MKWLWVAIAGLVGWLVLVARTLPQWLAGRVSLPRHEPEPTPDPTPVEERAQEAVAAATAQAEEAKAPHVRAVEELAQTVDAVPATKTRAKRRALLQKLADKADKP